MQQTSHLSRAAHLMLAVLLAIAMCVPVYAYADDPAGDQASDAVAGQAASSDEAVGNSDVQPESDAPSSREPAAQAPDSSEPDAPVATPAAVSAVTMQQGAGEAKDYDSIASALADVADYDYKTNKEAYVIMLNWHVDEPVTIPANKKVTIDLNGKQFKTADDALVVESRLATVQDSQGGGRIESMYGTAVTVRPNAKLAVSGGRIVSHTASYGVINNGTLTMTDGSLGGIANNGTATISGGTVEGGIADIAIRNAGKLTIKGGSVSNGSTDPNSPAIIGYPSSSLTISNGQIGSPGTAVHVTDPASLQISGGSISGDQCGVDADGAAKVDISGGALASSNGFALSVGGTAVATVSGGDFTSAAGSKAINRVSNATVTLSGGTFNVASAADICDSPVFVDRYSAVERDGKVVVEMTSPAAVVIAEDGSQTAYETFTKACSNAPAYSTVKLMEDAVLGKYSAEVKQYGVTVDLNGFSIDGTAYTGSKAVLTMSPKYGSKPVDGKDSTLRLINGQPASGGVVKGKLPVQGNCGDSHYDAPLFIGDEVTLEVIGDGVAKVKLDSSAYLVYSDKAAAYIGNGGFKVKPVDGAERIYGSYASAAGNAAEGTVVTMLNDYTGNETIYSGSSVATLDLGGHTYTYTGKQQVFYVNYDNAGIVVKNGEVVATQALDQAGVAMYYSNGTFTMDHVAMSIPGESWGIGTNGTKTDNVIALKDSTLNVPDGLGIYFPGTGSVTIENSVINAKHFGVQVCAGDLFVTGDKTSITATGTPQQKTEGDGPIIDGAAVSIVEREGYQDLGTVSIEAGTFKSDASSEAVKAYAFNSTDKVEGEWPEAGSVVSVSGGTFSSPVDDAICADGFGPQQNADGSYGVHEHTFTIAKSDADGHWTECGVCGAMTAKQNHAFTVAEHDAESHWMKCEGCDATTDKTPHAFTLAEHDADGHWMKCEGCDAVTEKTPHVSDAWESDAEGHWGTCSECGATIGKTAHAFEWVVDKEATETEPGSKHEECSVCGFAKDAVEIPAIGGGASGDDSGSTQGGGSASKPGSGQDGTLAQTGDVTAVLTGSLVLFSIVSAALLFLARRKVSDR